MDNRKGSLSQTNEALKSEEHSLSEPSSSLYLLVSALLGFLIIRLFTTQEIIVALGTIIFAVLGMWVLAVFYRVRLIIRSLRRFRRYEIKGEKQSISRGITDA